VRSSALITSRTSAQCAVGPSSVFANLSRCVRSAAGQVVRPKPGSQPVALSIPAQDPLRCGDASAPLVGA
jgi:hypothetical protein